MLFKKKMSIHACMLWPVNAKLLSWLIPSRLSPDSKFHPIKSYSQYITSIAN